MEQVRLYSAAAARDKRVELRLSPRAGLFTATRARTGFDCQVLKELPAAVELSLRSIVLRRRCATLFVVGRGVLLLPSCD